MKLIWIKLFAKLKEIEECLFVHVAHDKVNDRIVFNKYLTCMTCAIYRENLF